MTLTDLLDFARRCILSSAADHDTLTLSRAIIDLLGEAQPCGWEAPEVTPRRDDNGRKIDGYWVGVPDEWTTSYMEPSEARAMARMLLVAADEAEARHG